MYKKVEVRRGDVSHELFIGNGDILLDIMIVYSDEKFVRAVINR